MSNERLQEILQSGTEEECLKYFYGMPEKNRREHFPKIKAIWKEARSNRVLEVEPGKFMRNPAIPVIAAAYLATATLSEMKQARRDGRPRDDIAFAVLSDRRPDWIDEWITTLLDDTYYWAHWRLIRRLVAASLAQNPESPKYYLGMIGALAGAQKTAPLAEALVESPDLLEHDVWKLFEYDGEGENSLANTDRFGSSWSEAFIALMKEGKLPRAKLLDSTLEALERDFNHYRARWFHAFYDLLEPTNEELRAHAQRFLGLLRASAPNVATWALEKVERLAQSGCYTAEALSQAIEPILQARAKGTVLQALKLLELQAAVNPKRQASLAATAATALAHEKADVQTAVIAFLEKTASAKDAAVRDVVEKYANSVAASVRGRVHKWLAQAESTAPPTRGLQPDTKGTSTKKHAKKAGGDKAATAVSQELQSLLAIDELQKNLQASVPSIPAAKFDGTDIARLTRLRKLEPINELEELIDVCARVIEDGSLVDDVERAIDGLARLCGSKPENFERLTGPLLKRVRHLIKKGSSPFFGIDPGNDILGLVYAFCTDRVIEKGENFKPKHGLRGVTYDFEGETIREYEVNLRKPIGFLSLRSLDVARRIAQGSAFQPLCTPTHEQGWIDPRELAARVNDWSGGDPDASDVILAMLRLAPEFRSTALDAIQAKSSEWIQAIRYALGADKIPIGSQAALWIAAARARAPWKDDEHVLQKFPDAVPDAAIAAKVSLRFKQRKYEKYTFIDAHVDSIPPAPKSIDPLLVTVTMHVARSMDEHLVFEMGGFGGKTNGAVRWTSMIWPIARESYFAGCAQDCLDNLDWSEARWQNRTSLEPLLDSGTPLRYAGLILLTAMLSAKEPGESGLAIDVAIRAIEGGRLGSDNLGAGLAELLPCGLIKPGRWQKTLSEVARASQLHAAVIQIALQQCFTTSTAKSLPKDSSKLLELLYELSVELGIPITNAACREYLTGSDSSGKAGKLAKSLLKLEAAAESQEAIKTVLESAIEQRSSKFRLLE